MSWSLVKGFAQFIIAGVAILVIMNQAHEISALRAVPADTTWSEVRVDTIKAPPDTIWQQAMVQEIDLNSAKAQWLREWMEQNRRNLTEVPAQKIMTSNTAESYGLTGVRMHFARMDTVIAGLAHLEVTYYVEPSRFELVVSDRILLSRTGEVDHAAKRKKWELMVGLSGGPLKEGRDAYRVGITSAAYCGRYGLLASIDTQGYMVGLCWRN